MHKISSAALAAYLAAVEATRKAFNTASIAVHAVLVRWHLANLRALVKKAEDRAQRFIDLKWYHYAQAKEADSYATDAQVQAAAAHDLATQEAESLGATLYKA
ncbi:hypothetical protein R6138_04573 [Ralstonia thomasii]|uniref:hypothetical protein n=1 Tax=Ralstonia thomasii TaxID=3058596 RepID=UPI0028F5CECA|nr:hypothetical protein [Ralstonia sp. LMG 18095]CAJ0901378.1 hypothetical protein R6138_04573 [Ralstonia sp. LMG 18095]